MYVKEPKEDKINLDPRARLLLGLFSLVLLLTSKGVLFPISVLCICLGILWQGSMPMRRLLHRFWEPLLVVTVLFFIKLLTPKGQPFFDFHIPIPLIDPVKIAFYEGSIREGIFLALRVISCVAVIVVVGEYMALHEFIYSLSWLRVPKEVVEILLLANRFLFSLLEEARVIFYSQKNRLGYVSLRNSFRSMGYLSGALVIKVLERGQKASASMVQRGYEGNIPIAKPGPLKKTELIGMPLIMTGLLILWWI